jgi:hypothetical protein
VQLVEEDEKSGAGRLNIDFVPRHPRQGGGGEIVDKPLQSEIIESIVDGEGASIIDGLGLRERSWR